MASTRYGSTGARTLRCILEGLHRPPLTASRDWASETPCPISQSASGPISVDAAGGVMWRLSI
jgi:hypothetical protein